MVPVLGKPDGTVEIKNRPVRNGADRGSAPGCPSSCYRMFCSRGNCDERPVLGICVMRKR